MPTGYCWRIAGCILLEIDRAKCRLPKRSNFFLVHVTASNACTESLQHPRTIQAVQQASRREIIKSQRVKLFPPLLSLSHFLARNQSNEMDWTASAWNATPRPSTADLSIFFGSCSGLVALYHSLVYVYDLDPARPTITTTRTTGGELEKGREEGDTFVVGNVGESEKKAYARALKVRSWICTATSSLVMTVASVPFVLDLVNARGNISLLSRREEVARPLVVFFMAYLAVDCSLGWTYYRSQFNILTGWVHHSAYFVLLSLIMRVGCCHVFALAAVMEVRLSIA